MHLAGQEQRQHHPRHTAQRVILARRGVIRFELDIAAPVFGTARTADGRALYDVRTRGLEPG